MEFTEDDILNLVTKTKQSLINIMFNLGSLHAMQDLLKENNITLSKEALDKIEQEELMINEYLNALNNFKNIDGVLNIK